MATCPVSLEPFQHPRVLTCGHTIDHTSLEALKKQHCPVCREPFFGHMPTNYALAELLQIDLGSLPVHEDSIHKRLRQMHTRHVQKIVEPAVPLILARIQKRAAEGYRTCVFCQHELKCSNTKLGVHIMRHALPKKLERAGFRTRTIVKTRLCFWRECVLGITW